VTIDVTPPSREPTVPTVRVWDRTVRALHWALVASVALCALGLVAFFGVHQPAGYAALAIVGVRIVWGFVGGRHARFAQFMRSPRASWVYARAVLRRDEPRHLGHNPLGAWMVVALMVCIAGLAFTGWLYTTDMFWGDARVEALHLALAWALLVLVALHVGGALFTGRRHRENLVRSMIDGKKRAPTERDIA
jgi:cytochrome b